MTISDWNPDDYRFDFPDIPRYEGPLIDMPIHHKIEKLRCFFTGEIVGEIRRCLSVEAGLSRLILCLAAVDYLSGFVNGRESTGVDFKAFLKGKYFPAAYEPYVDDICVQLRNGLMHNLVIVNPWHSHGTKFIVHTNSSNHLRIDDDEKLIFSVATFAEDIRRAFWMYAYDLIMNADSHPELIDKFHKRFNRLDGQGAFLERNAE